MSVINKMLQDLESRHAEADGINADYQPPVKKRLSIWLLLLLVILILVLVYVAWNYAKQTPKSTNEIANVAAAEKPDFITREQKNVENVVNTSPQIVEEKPIMVSQVIDASIKIEELNVAPELNNDADGRRESVESETEELDVLPVISQERDGEDTSSEASTKAPTNIPLLEESTPVLEPAPSDAEAKATFSMKSSHKTQQDVSVKQVISEHLAAGNKQQAMLLLDQLVKDEPENIKARKKLASLHFAQGHHAQAKLLLSDGIEQFNQRADFRLMLARILVLEQQPEQAMQWLESVTPPFADEEFLAYRAALAQQLKQAELALHDYLSLTRISPNNGKWWLGLGIVADQLGQSSQALSAYQSAHQTNQLDVAITDFVQQRILILSEPQ